jgi:hypothetical protein
MDFSTSNAPPNVFLSPARHVSFLNQGSPAGNTPQAHIPNCHITHVDVAGKGLQNNRAPRPLPMDLAEEIKGMYRIMNLISKSGIHGNGNEHV